MEKLGHKSTKVALSNGIAMPHSNPVWKCGEFGAVRQTSECCRHDRYLTQHGNAVETNQYVNSGDRFFLNQYKSLRDGPKNLITGHS